VQGGADIGGVVVSAGVDGETVGGGTGSAVGNGAEVGVAIGAMGVGIGTEVGVPVGAMEVVVGTEVSSAEMEQNHVATGSTVLLSGLKKTPVEGTVLRRELIERWVPEDPKRRLANRTLYCDHYPHPKDKSQ
jgi:hypothetical protein